MPPLDVARNPGPYPWPVVLRFALKRAYQEKGRSCHRKNCFRISNGCGSDLNSKIDFLWGEFRDPLGPGDIML